MISGIIGNKINYADHVVVCDPIIAATDEGKIYIARTASLLSVDGCAAAHRRELKLMNNDGTWVVVSL